MDIGTLIKEKRNAMGYTQMKLAVLAGVSLPTIQNLELGKGNPTLELLEKIGKPLNCFFDYIPQDPNWELLEQCGLPIKLSPVEKKPQKIKIAPLKLASQLKLAIHMCLQKGANERIKEAVAALTWAIQHHYPTFYLYCLECPETKAFLMTYPLKGRILKLMRMASSGLSQIL